MNFCSRFRQVYSWIFLNIFLDIFTTSNVNLIKLSLMHLLRHMNFSSAKNFFNLKKIEYFLKISWLPAACCFVLSNLLSKQKFFEKQKVLFCEKKTENLITTRTFLLCTYIHLHMLSLHDGKIFSLWCKIFGIFTTM